MGFKQCRVHKRYLSEKESASSKGIEVKVGVGTSPIINCPVKESER